MRNDISDIVCVSCGKSFSYENVPYTCPSCGEIRGTLSISYSKNLREKINPLKLKKNRDFSIKRYLPILPLSDDKLPQIPVGMTPFFKLKEGNFYIKDDTKNPSSSLKDRASWVCVADAMQRGFKTICVASTGNAASSLATIGVGGALCVVIFCPEKTPDAKLTQMLVMGANVFLIKGNYDDAFDLLQKVAHTKGWYLRSTAINPLCGEGKKTLSFEIWEQLGYKVPDLIFLPVGDGCIYSGVYKGFKDLMDIGVIEKMPRVIGVQAEGSSPLAKSFEDGKSTTERIIPETIADSISVGFPRDQVKALLYAREYKGAIIKVSDKEIIDGIYYCAKDYGVFAEPSAAASYAGFLKFEKEGKIKDGETSVIVITGSGLKDIKSSSLAIKKRPVISENEIDDILKKLKTLSL